MSKDRAVPLIDERVRFQGVSTLRLLNEIKLRKLLGPIVIQTSNGHRIAVVIPYEQYLELQNQAVRS